MPNWCNNSVTLRHKDPAMIERVLKGKDGLLMEFMPTPQELIDTVSGWMGEDKQAAHEAQQARNIEKYGFKDWYDWNVANWGTKWDVSLDSVERIDPNTVGASFESAWAPPVVAYERLCEMGFEIKAYYDEPGMCFCGVVTGNEEFFDDDYREYSGESSETVREVIGEELDDYFAISENMAQWEEENEEE
jgi:hypothetical protein